MNNKNCIALPKITLTNLTSALITSNQEKTPSLLPMNP